MGDIVNLHKARKRAARERAAKRAIENRFTHGRSKAERDLEAARAERTQRLVEMHKIDPGDTS